MTASLQQLEALFTEAAALPVAARAEFFARSCGGDAALRTRVEGMLRTSDTLGGFLEATVAPGFAETAVGARIGRYKLREKLGEGGVGVVFLAEQEEPVRRLVALKVIKPGMDTREVIARFESERQALAWMDHPHIARVFDAGATPAGRPFFVMELVNGPAITNFCDDRRLPLALRLGMFVKVCRAIQHAHEKGIVHRDIKASNILVATHDGEPMPKVIDFGIAKATEFRLTEKTLLTVFPRFMGTPGYMSPEQAAEEGGEIDARSDIYSLGVLLCELVTGRTPLGSLASGVGLAEIRRRICEDGPRSPADLLDELDDAALLAAAELRNSDPATLGDAVEGALSWIALRCLAKDRADRYPSARTLAEDVQRFLNGGPVEAKPPAMFAMLKNQFRQHRAARWLGAAAAAAADGFSNRRPAASGSSPATPQRTVNVEAHRMVLEGRRHWNEFTEDGFVRAEAAFAKALEISPGYTMALAGLAYVSGRRAILSMVAAWHIETTLLTAARYAHEALARDPNIAEAHAVLGVVALLRGERAEAARHLDHALLVNPNSELAWCYLAIMHRHNGRPDLAIPALENARLLTAAPAFSLHWGLAFLQARRYRDVLAVHADADRAGSVTSHALAQTALALVRLGRKAEALVQARRALEPARKAEETAGMNALSDGLAAWALAESGAPREAETLVGAILNLPQPHHFTAAFALAMLGDRAKALTLFAHIPPWCVEFVLLFARDTGAFEGDAGFEQLLQRRNAVEAWQSLRQVADDSSRAV